MFIFISRSHRLPPPVITQTQELIVAPDSLTNPFVGASRSNTPPVFDGSPLANNSAIAAMTAGNMAIDSDLFDTGQDYAKERLELYKDNVGKKKAVKLTPVRVFNFLRQCFVKDLMEAF